MPDMNRRHGIAVDSGWHTWRVQWDEAGMRFWKDYVDGAQPYFDVPANSLPDWQFNEPGYQMFPILGPAVAVRWWRSRTGDLSGGHARRLGSRLVLHGGVTQHNEHL